MPSLTIKQPRQQGKQNEQDEQPFPEDRVTEGVLMYPVFCTANIPLKILDEFINQAYKGAFDAVGNYNDPDASGGSPCILQMTDLDSVTHGSRKPMQDFESPFLNWTDDQIRDWMLKHQHPNFAQSTFTVLDQNAIDCKVCRIGYVDEKEPDNRMLWAEFWGDLYVRVAIEMCTMSWDEEELVGTEKVFNRKTLEEEDAKGQETIEQMQSKG